MTKAVSRTVGRTPVGVDVNRPSLARVCNRLLGGKDNYQPDDHVVAQLEQAAPGQRAAARRSREFQQRVLQYLASTVGITQFLDLGAGLPAPSAIPNTHQITGLGARGEADRPTVVYIDNDPLCNAHGRALMADNDRTHYVMGDLTDPALLRDPTVSTYLDADAPIGVLLCGVLHHFEKDLDPGGIVRGWVEVLPSGSFLALTHLFDPGSGHPLHPFAAACQDRYLCALGSGWFRSREEITGFFDGMEILAPSVGADPGLVAPDQWWPYGPPVRFKSVAERLVTVGVGWKP
ncbi:SAM-dependent methyltransferase [Nocardia fusca]|uniref:SAM-dependent methyltransferase n=1 Tax=Nocardia fusca TaxID=941183 RepID=UPI0007A73498|nr:SAM-dependent methyltransferase [Nocardia fusca]